MARDDWSRDEMARDDLSRDGLTVYEMDALDYEETHRSVFSSLETAHESKPLPAWVREISIQE